MMRSVVTENAAGVGSAKDQLAARLGIGIHESKMTGQVEFPTVIIVPVNDTGRPTGAALLARCCDVREDHLCIVSNNRLESRFALLEPLGSGLDFLAVFIEIVCQNLVGENYEIVGKFVTPPAEAGEVQASC